MPVEPPLPSSSESDDYTGGAADAIAGAPAGGDGSCAEMCRRVAEVEYGDRSGGIVEALRDAACRVAFGWDDMVWYCELDEGDGRMNRDAASAMHLGVHGFSGEYGREWDARLLGSTDLDEARRTMLQGLSPHIVRAAEAKGVLLRSADEYALVHGRAPNAVRIAIAANLPRGDFESATRRLAELLARPPADLSV